MVRSLIFVLLTFSSVCLAQRSRLIPQASALTLMGAEVEASKPSAVPVPTLVTTGAFVALLSAPLGLAAGIGIGSLSNNLFGALIPALLTAVLVPSIAVVLTEWILAERGGKGRFRLIPTLLVSVAAQTAIVAAAIFLGANATTISGLAAMTLASAIVLPSVTTAMLKLTERSPVVAVPIVSGTF